MFFKKIREEMSNARAEIAALTVEIVSLKDLVRVQNEFLTKIREDASAARAASECTSKTLSAHSLAVANAHVKLEDSINALNTVIEGEKRDEAPTIDTIVDELMNGVSADE